MFENCNYIVLIPNLRPPYLYNIGSILFEEPSLRFALSFSFKKKKMNISSKENIDEFAIYKNSNNKTIEPG